MNKPDLFICLCFVNKCEVKAAVAQGNTQSWDLTWTVQLVGFDPILMQLS